MTTTKPLIIVVDDEFDSRIFLYSLLDSAGYAVATCAGPFEALKIATRLKPQVVVSDVRMPEMEGLELLSKVKYASPETKVILITAYGDWPMYLETLERGGDELLLKPFKNEELLRAVERVLEGVNP